jgi:hypothetical protein
MSSGFLKEKHIKAIEFPHFPTRQQAIVWRNWEMVPVERIAKALNTNKENILKLAEEMGLNIPPDINEYWLERGYITIIRQNWHLLTYKQILILLDWTKQKLEYTLKEDDFLFHKLGHFKPEVEEVVYSPLSQEEKAQTVQIRELIKEYFPETKSSSNFDPFGFLKDFVENRQSESIYFTQCEEDRVVHDDEIINECKGIYGFLPKLAMFMHALPPVTSFLYVSLKTFLSNNRYSSNDKSSSYSFLTL